MNATTALTPDQAAQGMTINDLAATFGVDPKRVRSIIRSKAPVATHAWGATYGTLKGEALTTVHAALTTQAGRSRRNNPTVVSAQDPVALTAALAALAAQAPDQAKAIADAAKAAIADAAKAAIADAAKAAKAQ